MEAASAASALPSVNASSICCIVPAPPDAITGILTSSPIFLLSMLSNPALVPSASIEVTSNSPAPLLYASFAHSSASIPVSLRPPWVKICHLSSATLFASIATTIH